MRRASTIIVLCAATAGSLALLLLPGVAAAGGHPGAPQWALLTFAVAAFSGPVP